VVALGSELGCAGAKGPWGGGSCPLPPIEFWEGCGLECCKGSIPQMIWGESLTYKFLTMLCPMFDFLSPSSQIGDNGGDRGSRVNIESSSRVAGPAACLDVVNNMQWSRIRWGMIPCQRDT
jgi:hypothetical protein